MVVALLRTPMVVSLIAQVLRQAMAVLPYLDQAGLLGLAATRSRVTKSTPRLRSSWAPSRLECRT